MTCDLRSCFKVYLLCRYVTTLVSSEIAKPTKFNSKRQDAVNEPFKLMNKTDTLKTISRVKRFISQLILFIVFNENIQNLNFL